LDRPKRGAGPVRGPPRCHERRDELGVGALHPGEVDGQLLGAPPQQAGAEFIQPRHALVAGQIAADDESGSPILEPHRNVIRASRLTRAVQKAG
jgi:hypothetical protein